MTKARSLGLRNRTLCQSGTQVTTASGVLLAGRGRGNAQVFDRELKNLFNDLQHGGAGRLDLKRVYGGAQRRNSTFAVNLVPNPHVIQYSGEVGFVSSFDKLAVTTSRPLFQGGLQVDLERRLRKDDGTDISAHHHYSSDFRSAHSVLKTNTTLLAAQLMPDKPVRGHDGNDAVDAWTADRPGDIQFPDLNRRLAAVMRFGAGSLDSYRQLLGYASNSLNVSAIDASVQYGPGDRPIHDASIEEDEFETLGYLVTDSALA